MNALLIILSFVIIVPILFLKYLREKDIVEHHAPVIEPGYIGYKKKHSIMNHTEAALFFEIKRQLPKDHYVFPNMRIADVIDAINGYGFYQRRNKILPKHIDFVICDPNFRPTVAIELNGGYHNKLSQLEKDEEKRQILEDANLPFATIKVGDNFADSVEKIISSFL